MATDTSTPLEPRSDRSLDRKDRIQILLAEYAALRAEIVSRTGYGFQLAAVFAALVTWSVKETMLRDATGAATPSMAPATTTSTGPTIVPDSHPYLWAILVGVFALFAMSCYINTRDLTRAAHRIKELEHEVNSRAGEHLLVWETLSGVLTRMGLIKSFFSRVRPLSRSALPPLDPELLRQPGT